ncbi:membrane protein, partial [Carbonactinospora thermoautotrophica]
MDTRDRRPGDLLVRAGGVVFAIGVVGVVATVLPLFLGTRPLPPAFYWLSMLAPLGLALAL